MAGTMSPRQQGPQARNVLNTVLTVCLLFSAGFILFVVGLHWTGAGRPVGGQGGWPITRCCPLY